MFSNTTAQRVCKLVAGLAHAQGRLAVTPVLSSRFVHSRDGDTRSVLSGASGGSVLLHKDDESGIATLTLIHPARKNAISGSMMLDFADAVFELESWEKGKGVVLHGSKNTFCSGGDLQLMQRITDPSSGVKMCQFMQNTLNRLYKLPIVSVALLEGQVLGGGAELATACDFRIVTESVAIGFVQARMGVSPGWGGGTRLVEQVGRTAALSMLCSGKIMSWKEAIDCGFAQSLIRDEDSVAHAKKWLLDIVKHSTEASQAMKTIVVNAMDNAHEVSLRKEKEVFGSLWGGMQHLEALRDNVRHDA